MKYCQLLILMVCLLLPVYSHADDNVWAYSYDDGRIYVMWTEQDNVESYKIYLKDANTEEIQANYPITVPYYRTSYELYSLMENDSPYEIEVTYRLTSGGGEFPHGNYYIDGMRAEGLTAEAVANAVMTAMNKRDKLWKFRAIIADDMWAGIELSNPTEAVQHAFITLVDTTDQATKKLTKTLDPYTTEASLIVDFLGTFYREEHEYNITIQSKEIVAKYYVGALAKDDEGNILPGVTEAWTVQEAFEYTDHNDEYDE